MLIPLQETVASHILEEKSTQGKCNIYTQFAFSASCMCTEQVQGQLNHFPQFLVWLGGFSNYSRWQCVDMPFDKIVLFFL